MTTTVVNLRTDAYDEYIGRAGKGEDGLFGNPITTRHTCDMCGELHSTPGSTIPCYKEYFYKRIREDESFRRRIHSLKGLKLGCFCKPRPCHGDIIADYLNNIGE